MANYNKQIEKWMSKASFDKLDLSTIPEGTEINIVGDIVESDLSLELQNKINTAGGHCFKIEFDTGELSNGVCSFIVNTKASTVEELAADLIERKIILGTSLLPPNTGYGNTTDVFGSVTLYLSTASVSGDDLTLTGNSITTSIVSGQILNPEAVFTQGWPINYTATVTKLW